MEDGHDAAKLRDSGANEKPNLMDELAKHAKPHRSSEIIILEEWAERADSRRLTMVPAPGSTVEQMLDAFDDAGVEVVHVMSEGVVEVQTVAEPSGESDLLEAQESLTESGHFKSVTVETFPSPDSL